MVDRVPRQTDNEDEWAPEAVQRLRARLGLSQTEFASRVGTRQQTISEWETGTRTPRRMSRRLLRLVAEESGVYDIASPTPDAADGASA